jgi:uncharacterized surface protein with fasciclin (FAS1) repeats
LKEQKQDMKIGNRVLRLVLALSIAGAISSQVPIRGGSAVAQDGYGGGGGGGRPIVQAAAFGIAAYGIYSTIAGGGGNVPAPPPPPNAPGSPAGAPGGNPAGAAVPAGDTRPIWDVANETEGLKTFARVSEAAGQKERLRQAGQYTAFIPNDAAFTALDAATLADLQRPENQARLAAVIGYHVVEGRYTIEELRTLATRAAGEGLKLTTITGQTLTVTNDATGLKVNGVAIQETDTPASNGIIHPVGTVLVPAS